MKPKQRTDLPAMHLTAVLRAVILLSYACMLKADISRNCYLLEHCGGTIEIDSKYSGAVELGDTVGASSPCMVQLKTNSPYYIHLVTKEIRIPCRNVDLSISGDGNIVFNSSADCGISTHVGSSDLAIGEGYRQLDVSLIFNDSLSLDGIRFSFEYHVGNSISPVAPAPVQVPWQLICNSCDSNATCDFNFRTGSAKCSCKAGFTGNGTICTESDPCEPNPCGEEDCVRLEGQDYKCRCYDGFQWSSRKKNCEDINECLNLSSCSGGSTCRNTRGSFSCICPQGTSYNGTSCNDIDECNGANQCHNEALCVNTQGSYICTCKPGFDGNGYVCQDTNECLDGTVCAENAICTNSPGSYTCRCKDNFSGDGKTCQGGAIQSCYPNNTIWCSQNSRCVFDRRTSKLGCECTTGYEGDGQQCNDIDECTVQIDSCDKRDKICLNRDGTFECRDKNSYCAKSAQTGKVECWCKPGYEGDYNSCKDVNECMTGNHSCHHLRDCSNTDGSYSCTCTRGYTGNGKECQDIDECVEKTDNCEQQGKICLNTLGSFECRHSKSTCSYSILEHRVVCQCDTGYTGPYTDCTDIDECATGNHSCHHQADCSNTDGSYGCTCTRGYTGNGKECQDINECLGKTDNCTEQDKICLNTAGSFECRHPKSSCSYSILEHRVVCQCDAGYTGPYTDCTDVNECSISSACPGGSTCVNQPGGYTCSCPRGFRYIKESFTCQTVGITTTRSTTTTTAPTTTTTAPTVTNTAPETTTTTPTTTTTAPKKITTAPKTTTTAPNTTTTAPTTTKTTAAPTKETTAPTTIRTAPTTATTVPTTTTTTQATTTTAQTTTTTAPKTTTTVQTTTTTPPTATASTTTITAPKTATTVHNTTTTAPKTTKTTAAPTKETTAPTTIRTAPTTATTVPTTTTTTQATTTTAQTTTTTAPKTTTTVQTTTTTPPTATASTTTITAPKTATTVHNTTTTAPKTTKTTAAPTKKTTAPTTTLTAPTTATTVPTTTTTAQTTTTTPPTTTTTAPTTTSTSPKTTTTAQETTTTAQTTTNTAPTTTTTVQTTTITPPATTTTTAPTTTTTVAITPTIAPTTTTTTSTTTTAASKITTTTAPTTIPIDSTTLQWISISGVRSYLSLQWSITHDLLKNLSAVNETIRNRLKRVEDRYQNDYPLLPVIVQLINSTYDLSKGYLWMAYEVQYFQPNEYTNEQPHSYYANDRISGRRIFKPVETIYGQDTYLNGDPKDSEQLSYRGTEIIVAQQEEIFKLRVCEPLQ